MSHSPRIDRRSVARWARVGVAASLVVLTHAGLTAFGGGTVLAAATFAGVATVDGPGTPAIAGGNSDTQFLLNLPEGAACTGDSATDNYRVQTFMAVATTDPATLTFGGSGPNNANVGASFLQPLFAATGNSPVSGRLAAPVSGQVDDGVVFSLAAVTSGGVVQAQGVLPEGDYILGYMCTVGTALDKYWTATLTIAHDDTESRAGITFAVQQTDPGTDTTTTTSTTTTTVADGGIGTTSTTTAPAGVDTSTTTTTLASSVANAGGSTGANTGTTTGTTTTSSNRNLPRTGPPTWWIVTWAVLLLILGRVAILAGRTPKVLPPRSR